MSFETLGLSEKVLSAVLAAGYTEPTPIQAGAIPHVLERRDVLGLAQTGTGKTASFVLPMLTLLEKGRARARMPRTLILEPTRELAAQVEENFSRYGVNHKINIALLIGGVSFEEQNRKLARGVDVLIATPGRLLDHSERGKLLMQGIEILVIDEADRMLDMGFIPDIERICKLLPATRQTLFFSATMPKEIQHLVDKFLTNPARVEVSAPSSTAENVAQTLVASRDDPKDKRAALRRLIEDAKDLTNAIIFCNRKRDVGVVARSLERHGLNAGALHGDMDQRSRTNMLDGFRKNTLTYLVASDVAARGLDIPAVSHVFNYDVPHSPEDYVHRIGRTGRAGRAGTTQMIVTPGDKRAVDNIEKLIGKKIPWEGNAPAAPAADDDAAPAARSSGRRRSGTSSRRGRDTEAKPAPAETVDAADTAETKPVETHAEPAAETKAETKPAPRSRRGSRSKPAEAAPPKEPAAAAPTPPAPSAPAPAPAARTAPAARDTGSRDTGARDRSSSQRGGGRRSRQEAEPVFGESEFVPAFLLRPVRPSPAPQPSTDDEDGGEEDTSSDTLVD
ncbi:DEAD/DEAH box helicase [Amorphus sp. MBR-141]